MGVVAHSRADRFGRRARNWVTLGRSGQRASGKHADSGDADIGRKLARHNHLVGFDRWRLR
jgi:hypothetical protein